MNARFFDLFASNSIGVAPSRTNGRTDSDDFSMAVLVFIYLFSSRKKTRSTFAPSPKIPSEQWGLSN